MHIMKSSFWRAGWHILLSLAVLLPGVPLPSVPLAHSEPHPTANTITTRETTPENITSPPIELAYTEVPTVP